MKSALGNRALYGTLKNERLLLILQAVDRQLHTNKSDDYTIHSKQTIEHLMPQNWVKHWPLPGNLGSSEDETRIRDSLLHTLGNLTLVSTGLNSSLSNSAWSTKLPEIQKHASIHLNRSLPTVWNENEITSRGADLADLVLLIWPGP